jgi:histidinol-phosphate aminotransferase
LAADLRARNILVRHFDKPRTEEWLRITVGTREQCEALADAVDALTSARPSR